MSISPVGSALVNSSLPLAAAAQPSQAAAGVNDPQVRKQFDQFVGETLFGQLLKSMRKNVGKPAYFHGGQAEEVFRTQLDQVLAQKLAETHAPSFTGPMFDLFTLQRP